MSEVHPSALLERYQRLVMISRDLASTLDLTALLNRIGHAAADLSNAQAASILLYDENKQQLYFESATNLEEPMLRGLVVPVENSVAGWIVLNRQPLILNDAQKDSRHFGEIARATHIVTTSLLGVPLIAKDKVIGVLEVINKRAGEFNEEDQDVLMALGSQAAVAIENARLFQQSDLIAEMVHELRTPLASLSTAAHLLTRPDVSEEQRRKVIEVIRTETMRLSEMTTAFLDLARLESGRAQFHPQVIDLGMVLEECTGIMRTRAIESGLKLSLKTPERIPRLRADRDKIKQMLLNLLSNAIKYNRPGGSICVEVEVEEQQVVIVVRDSGMGIQEQDMPHLFERFFRGRTAEHLVPGTGLGLAICKRIVEAHKGSIEVQSQVGVGTTFRVRLPVEG